MRCSTEKVLAGKNPHFMIHYFGATVRTGWFKSRRECLRCGIVETERGFTMEDSGCGSQSALKTEPRSRTS